MNDYKKTHIPKRFWSMTLEDYRIAREGRSQFGSTVALETTREYIASLKENREFGTGLTYCGPPGTGKTMLMCITGMAAFDAGFSVLYLPLAKYIRQQLIVMKPEENQNEHNIDAIRATLVKARNKIDFLLLDDVGKEHWTESRYAEDEFDFLVRLRFDLGLPTLMTSNFDPEEWGKKTVSGQMVDRYGESMVSFIQEAAPPVETDAADYRKLIRRRGYSDLV